MYNLNKINLQLKSCQSLHPAQGWQQTVQCCQFHVWLRPSGYEHVADITQKQYKVYKNTFYIQWKVSAISLSNKLVDRLTPEGQVHYLMTLAVALAWSGGESHPANATNSVEIRRNVWYQMSQFSTVYNAQGPLTTESPEAPSWHSNGLSAMVGTGCVLTGLLLLVNWGDPGWWRHGIVCSLPHCPIPKSLACC